MLMPTKNRRAIYEYLFKEGVCVAKKDYNQKTHPDIQNVTNLEVIKAFVWQRRTTIKRHIPIFKTSRIWKLLRRAKVWHHGNL
uniref:40S ribosomal protein S10 n=1 Tax=Ascaris suum TaxID=6253 RepID=F1LEC3_ASCSU